MQIEWHPGHAMVNRWELQYQLNLTPARCHIAADAKKSGAVAIEIPFR